MRRGHAPWPSSAPVPAHASPDSGGTSRPSPATSCSRCGVGPGMGHSPHPRTSPEDCEKQKVSPPRDPWLVGEMPQRDALSWEERAGTPSSRFEPYSAAFLVPNTGKWASYSLLSQDSCGASNETLKNIHWICDKNHLSSPCVAGPCVY